MKACLAGPLVAFRVACARDSLCLDVVRLGLTTGIAMSQRSLYPLEVALVEGTSPGNFLAYAKWLSDSGDPLGELIALEVNAPESPEIPALRKAVAPVKDLGLTWENGLIVGGRVVENRKTGSGTTWIEAVCPSSAGRLLQRLTLLHNGANHSYKDVLCALVKAAPQALRSLSIEHEGATGFDGIAGLPVAAPRLEKLVLTGKFSKGAVKTLATPWPSLKVLSFDFHGTPVWKSTLSATLLGPLLDPSALPAIDRLRLERTGMGDDLLQHIAGSGLLSQLTVLQLGGFFTEDAVTAFTRQIPLTCSYVITRYEAVEERQRIVDLVQRCATPQRQADYERLWVQPSEDQWWKDTSTWFTGARGESLVGLFERYQSTLPDGTLHGRQTSVTSKQRTDEMYWFGVKHGLTTFFRAGKPAVSQRFRNGLRDDRVEVLPTVGSVEQRFGSELVTSANDRFTLGPRTPPNPTLASLPIIAEALRTADEGRVRVRSLTLTSGEVFSLVTYHLGDTLCGYILDGSHVVAVISDMNIQPPA